MTRSPRLRLSILCASAVLAALSLVGCSRESDDWKSAQAADTVAAYEQFLHQYPGSTHVSEANTRVTQLAEDEAWQLATSQDTQAGYQQFAARYPDGKWVQEARVRIENFALTPPSTDTPASVMANMSGTGTSTTTSAPAPAIKSAPAPTPVPAASPTPTSKPAAAASADKPASGYGVQLGAYSTKAKADVAWAAAAGRFKAELGGAKHEVVPGKSGAARVFRLRVAQPGDSAARGLCETLKARHQACVVYHP
jgi:cell division septation protein DedD